MEDKLIKMFEEITKYLQSLDLLKNENEYKFECIFFKKDNDFTFTSHCVSNISKGIHIPGFDDCNVKNTTVNI